MQPGNCGASAAGKAGRGAGVADLAAPLYTDMPRYQLHNDDNTSDLHVTEDASESNKDRSMPRVFSASVSTSTSDGNGMSRREGAGAVSPMPRHAELHRCAMPYTNNHRDQPRIVPSHLLPYRHLVRPSYLCAPIRLPLPHGTHSHHTHKNKASSSRGSKDRAGNHRSGDMNSSGQGSDANAQHASSSILLPSSYVQPQSPPRRPHLTSVECCMGLKLSSPRCPGESTPSNSNTMRVTLPYARWVRQGDVHPSRPKHQWVGNEKCVDDTKDDDEQSGKENDEVLYVGSRINWAAPIHALSSLQSPVDDAIHGKTISNVRGHDACGKRVHAIHIHIYDLHDGLMAKHSKALLGVHVPGLYHSSVVCYGLEFYFEGGVAIAAAGRTRFGTRFARYAVGTTTHALPVFLEWLNAHEQSTYHQASYHLTEHNCHHFTRDAVGWLVYSESGSSHDDDHGVFHEHDCHHRSHDRRTRRSGGDSNDSTSHRHESADSTRAVAAMHKSNDDDVVPRFLFDTVQTVLDTEVGGAVIAAVWHIMQGYQYVAAQQQLRRVTRRLNAVAMLEQAVLHSGVHCIPPSMVILFRTPQRVTHPPECAVNPKAFDQWSVRRVQMMLSHATGSNSRVALIALQQLTEQLRIFDCNEDNSVQSNSGNDVNVECGEDSSNCGSNQFMFSPQWAQRWVHCLTQLFLRQPQSQWTALLRLLRQALLHRVLATVCAFEPTLLSALLLAARDFPRLLPSAQKELLQVLCQWGSVAGVGQAVYTAPGYNASWVALAGMGLREPHAAIRYCAACLAVNLSLALTMAWAAEAAASTGQSSTSRSFQGARQVGRVHETRTRASGESCAARQGLRQLVTVLLFSLRFYVATGRATAEGTLHMMLLALVHAASSGSGMVNFVTRHRFRLPYYELLSRARSNESRALLCIMHAFEDMHQVQ